MSRRLQYLLCMCSTCLKLAQQHILWEALVILANFLKNFWKTLTALDPNIWPPVLIKYGKDFIIALAVDEKFLDVESCLLMLVNRQNTSPSHFLRNPTFGSISTTETFWQTSKFRWRIRFFGMFSLAMVGDGWTYLLV